MGKKKNGNNKSDRRQTKARRIVASTVPPQRTQHTNRSEASRQCSGTHEKRTKEITSARIFNSATDYSRSTREWADILTGRFGLIPEERRSILKQLRQVRMGQRKLCNEIRLRVPF